MSKIYYFNQLNYGNVPYNKPNGTKATVKSGGCGVVSATIVFDTLSQKQLYNPVSMAQFSQKCGARTNNGTDEGTLLNALCKANKGFSWKGTSDVNALVKHLQNGGMAICNQGSAYNVFSTQGHFVVAWRMVGNNIEVADPSNTKTKYLLYNRPKRIVKRTEYGCIVSPEQMKKATADRSPSYYLVSYKGASKDMDIKAGDKVVLTNNNVCYHSASKKNPYTLSEISKFYGTQKAQLKKGRTCTVKAVDKLGNGNIWLKIDVNSKPVYIIAYDKKKNATYVTKKA